MEKLSSALNNTLNDLLGDIASIQNLWKEAAEISNHSIPVKLAKNTLWVAVDHPLWKQELQGKMPVLLAKIKKRTGLEIKSVKIMVNPAYFIKPGTNKIKRQKIRERITPEELMDILSRLNGEFINQRLRILHEKMKNRRKNEVS